MASLNWAMTSPSGSPLSLPSEKFLFSATSITLSLFPSAPGAPLTQTPAPGTEYAAAGGTVHLSNKRVVYVAPPGEAGKGKRPEGKAEGMRTVSVPLERAVDGRLQQPWFGAPYYEFLADSAAEGGLEVSPQIREDGRSSTRGRTRD